MRATNRLALSVLAAVLICTGAAVPAAFAANPAPTVVRAAAGDTYWSIGRRYGVDVVTLEQANPNVPAWDVRPGALIRVPKVAATPVASRGVSQGDVYALARLIAAEER